MECIELSIKTLDLFCGGGGSSWGAFQAGAEIVMGVDAWGRAIDTYSMNFNGKGKQMLMDPETVPADLGLNGKGIDLLLASPECTNHTCAKGKKPRCEDSKRTANYVLNFARDLDPKWIVIENVVHMKKWDGFKDLISELEGRLNYKCTVQTLDASDFGVPQARRRMFIMCAKGTAPGEVEIPSLSVPTAYEILDFDPFFGKDTYLSNPFFAKPKAGPTIERFQRGVEALGKGNPFLIVYYGSDAAGGWQALDRPLRTITTLDRFGLVTWRDGVPYFRMLQVPELMRAMGFRDLDRYTFTGTRREQIKQLGNGVCPPVMEAIVRHITKGSSLGKEAVPKVCRTRSVAAQRGAIA